MGVYRRLRTTAWHILIRDFFFYSIQRHECIAQLDRRAGIRKGRSGELMRDPASSSGHVGGTGFCTVGWMGDEVGERLATTLLLNERYREP